MVYSIIVSTIFFIAVVFAISRLLKESILINGNTGVLSVLCADKTLSYAKHNATLKESLVIFASAFLFRVVVLVLSYFFYGVFKSSAPERFLDFLNHYNIWDAPHYLEIAKSGYIPNSNTGDYLTLVFFPLYPCLIRIFSLVFRNYIISALFVSFVSFGIGAVLMYKLCLLDYDKDIARRSLLFLSISPFSFFFGAIMTESLFFMLMVWVFLAIRKHNYLLAGILGIFASLTRSVGVLLIIPAFIEWLTHEKPISFIKAKQGKELLKCILKFLPAIIMVIGTLIYLYINYKTTGDALVFLKYQKENWYQGIQFFPKTLKNVLWSYLFSPTDWSTLISIFIPGFISVIIASVIILLSSRRIRLMYLVFMLVYFAYNAGATWPVSLSRYLMCMFPAYFTLSEITKTHKYLKTPLIIVMVLVFSLYLCGYITYHQIM